MDKTTEATIASHKENPRSSNSSAKYHVELHASQSGTPEGLKRALDIIDESIVPKPVDGPNKIKSDESEALAVVTARKAIEDAKGDLSVAQMRLEQAKLDTSKTDFATEEAAITDAQRSVEDKEVALQEAIVALQKKTNT